MFSELYNKSFLLVASHSLLNLSSLLRQIKGRHFLFQGADSKVSSQLISLASVGLEVYRGIKSTMSMLFHLKIGFWLLVIFCLAFLARWCDTRYGMHLCNSPL